MDPMPGIEDPDSMPSVANQDSATGDENNNNNNTVNNVETQDCITVIPLDGFPAERPPDFKTPDDMRVLNALKLTWMMTRHTWEPEARRTFLRLLPKATSLERRVSGTITRHPVARELLRDGTRASWAHYVILRHIHEIKFWNNHKLVNKLETEFPDIEELRGLSDWHEYIFKRQYRDGADEGDHGRDCSVPSYEPIRFTEEQRRRMEFPTPEAPPAYRPSEDSGDDAPLANSVGRKRQRPASPGAAPAKRTKQAPAGAGGDPETKTIVPVSPDGLFATTPSGHVQPPVDAEVETLVFQDPIMEELGPHGYEEQDHHSLHSIVEKFTKEVYDRFIAPQEHVKRQLQLYEELHSQLKKQLKESRDSCELHRQKADLAEEKNIHSRKRLEELETENNELFRDNTTLRGQQNVDAQMSRYCDWLKRKYKHLQERNKFLEAQGQVGKVEREPSPVYGDRLPDRLLHMPEQAVEEDDHVRSDVDPL